MIPKRMEGTTRVIGAPAGWDAERDGVCVSLPISDVEIDMGDGVKRNMQYSGHEPTPDDLRKLLAGGYVVLGFPGTVHPPIHVFVQEAKHEIGDVIHYAKAEDLPWDWQRLEVTNLETGEKMLNVVEVNSLEGWAVIETGEVEPSGDWERKRISGKFEIRYAS